MEGDGTGAGGTLMDIDVNSSGATSNPLIDITLATGVYAGNVFDVGVDVAATGNVINIDMNLGVAATAIRLDAGAGIRTQPLIEVIFDGASDTIGATLFDIDVTNTGATASPLFDIDVTGVYTGNIFDVVFGNASASTGDAFKVTTGTNLAGSALVIDATEATTRTDDLVKIDSADAGAAMVFDINLSGVHTGNVLDITYATAAATGNAIDLNMGTNVAGMAITIDSAGTGVTAEGSALNIVHTGVLVANADVVRIEATGNSSTTSHVLAVEQNTGAGGVGSYAVYINATGANVEGLRVDAGVVLFDETLEVTGATTLTGAATLSSTLTVTGATTLSSTLSYRNLTEVVTAANVLTAAESGSVFFLNSGTEFASTLPAPAAGLNFTFVITAAPSGANYTVVTESAANIIYGSAEVNGASVPAVAEDSINFVSAAAAIGDWVSVWCDGTNWYVKGLGVAAGSITFTAV